MGKEGGPIMMFIKSSWTSILPLQQYRLYFLYASNILENHSPGQLISIEHFCHDSKNILFVAARHALCLRAFQKEDMSRKNKV